MRKLLKQHRDRIKQLRKDRDFKKKEKTDLFKKALMINPQIAAIRAEIKEFNNQRAVIKEKMDLLLLDRAKLCESIRAKRKEINTWEGTKRAMFEAAKSKKSDIISADQEIMKIQQQIRTIQGKDMEW